MARNLARSLVHKLKSEETESRGMKSDNGCCKSLLNRRKFLLLGATATALGAGPSLVEASTGTSETFTTDFSGYV